MDSRGAVARPGPAAKDCWTVDIDGIGVVVTVKKVKRLRLVVYPDGRVRASAPKKATRREIEQFLRDRAGWIRKQLARGVAAPEPVVEGGTVNVWGDPMTVHLTKGRAGARPFGLGRITISVDDPGDADQVNRAVASLYRRETRAVVVDIVEKWSAALGRRPTSVTLRIMRTRWGSCTTSTGAIRINPELAARHPRYLSYVVLHEVAHLLVASHGREFRELMDAHMPNWRQLRAELNARG